MRIPRNKKVLAELKAIAKKNRGILKPEIVVQAAKSKNSVLHPYFEWSDTKAAHEYRLWQAREIVRVSVELIYPAQQKPTKVFVSLSNDRNVKGGGYRLVSQVMEDDDLRKIMLDDAMNEMKRFEEKYSALTELNDIFIAMHSVSAQVSPKPVKHRDFRVSANVAPA